MSLKDEGIFVRYIDLPTGVKGVTVPNEDGTFDIYINNNLCELKQEQTLQHELAHISKNHLYVLANVAEVEKVANTLSFQSINSMQSHSGSA